MSALAAMAGVCGGFFAPEPAHAQQIFHRQNRARGILDDALRRASKEDRFQAGAPACANHDQVSADLLRRFFDFFARDPGGQPHVDSRHSSGDKQPPPAADQHKLE